MKISRMLSGIDSHTAGEAARIITGGIPKLKGKTIAEKKQYLIEEKDDLRKALMLEPRGHDEMFGAFLIPAVSDEADFGIIFMDTGGYLNMCGHNTIAAVTAIVETGMVDVSENDREKEVVLEAPAGIIHATAHLDEPYHVQSVSFRNVPAFLLKRDVEINVAELGSIKLDVSFGGSFFAILPIAELNLKIEKNNSNQLAEIGMKILKAANEQIPVQHPAMDYINTIDLVEMYGEPQSSDATMQNVVVFGDGQVDRSPCGTGTSAKLATLYAKKQIGLNEPFVYESILNTKFVGRVVEETSIGGVNAIIPEITGSAYLTGFNTFLFDPSDPLSGGFTLK
ncbi:proline racemase family protein [Xylocopilactobacillus apicola]|uniref:Proline racemase n=1 Tax=Xylocopilactobacillus apicola TaxID=2932184 RepID=A0AAU9D827_9LACO|nr:proline racemase family protein [Xylocopilactobacillus apicola]BDR57610.1 proline racemase [Xylocopilactobacillus apicola]